MDSREECYFTKLPVTDGWIHVYTEWSAESVVIKILADEKQHPNKWHGNITKEILDSAAADLGLSCNVVKDECKLALTQNNGKETFLYYLQDGLFRLQKCKAFKITYLEIRLEETSENLHNTFLDYSAGIIETHLQLKQKQDEEVTHLKTEIVNLIKAYEKCKSEKKDLEISLFSKFALLLNSKKNRIVKLEKILNEHGIILKSKSKSGNRSEAKTIEATETDIIEGHDIDNDFDADTQIMTPEERTNFNILNLPKRKKPCFDENIPSTSKAELQHLSIQTCKEAAAMTSRMSPMSGENSSEEFFSKM